jgi:hypothetical protein
LRGIQQGVQEKLEFIARVTSRIPDKSQVMVRYFDLYANAHRDIVRKAEKWQPKLLIKEECPRIFRRGWAAMIRKVYKVDLLICTQCGGQIKVIAFIADFSVVDRITNHLKLSFVAAKPPPPHIANQELLMMVETGAEYFS